MHILKLKELSYRYYIFFMLPALFIPNFSAAQKIDSSLLLHNWEAEWITVPGSAPHDYGVYYFRKQFDLATAPASYTIHVSADNRYKLFVNEQLVSLGPARGDIMHWNFETIDIAPYLRDGNNILAAQVWNEGDLRPEGHISLQTAFILQGEPGSAQAVNTNDSWQCMQDSGYTPIPVRIPAYYVSGPGEFINMSQHEKNWKSISSRDDLWKPAEKLRAGNPKAILGPFGTPGGWLLQPSPLPQMELKIQRLQVVREVKDLSITSAFPQSATPITIPAGKEVTILLDQSFLTNAYPTLIFSGGKDASIVIGYQETLFTKYPAKGNRNETSGKVLVGRKDSLVSDGSFHQNFTSLNWRTYRYLQLHIITKGEPLVIEDLYGTFTGYPFLLEAKLETGDKELQKMLDIGWRTARLCAMETYMDCPYYEQLQYIGDSRIQALISLYNSGDDRLLRNALDLMDHSRQPEGVTESRHPSVTPQYIPTFSLWYIGMLHDYMMYGGDTDFVRGKLGGVREILRYFKSFQGPDGSLKNVPYWLFTDWVDSKGWEAGVAPLGEDGTSAVVDLQLLWAYQLAADMENHLGLKDFEKLDLQSASTLNSTINKKYWSTSKDLFADKQTRDLYSQHANVLAILTGTAAGSQAPEVAKKLLSDTTLAQASIYFKYYLHQALVKAGLGDDYLRWLNVWRDQMAMGLTTWAEQPDVNTSRSDCHAWGASPNIEFFRTILGIDSEAPGFTKVKIEPHLGNITDIAGEIPHPKGIIRVKYFTKSGHMRAEIELPQSVSGRLIWKAKEYKLAEGVNNIAL